MEETIRGCQKVTEIGLCEKPAENYPGVEFYLCRPHYREVAKACMTIWGSKEDVKLLMERLDAQDRESQEESNVS